VLNKGIRTITNGQKMSDHYWKKNFLIEFCHPVESFPDFEKLEHETNLQVFKRAFHLYKELRVLVKQMLEETLRNRLQHQK
jgi:hypothetical protein